MTRLSRIGFSLYLGSLLLYVFYSYSQVDPNLVLSSHQNLWKMQNWIWQLGFHQRYWSSLLYATIMVGVFGGYALLLYQVREKQLTLKSVLKIALTSAVILIAAYPALSHDVFNYLMNAKMVILYQANPHVAVALDFPQDPWLSFMHNVHTPAPYFYGWTLVSLVPGWIGQYHLKITVVLFKLLMLGFWWWLVKAQLRTSRGSPDSFWLSAFMLNPLVLIETMGNTHNDVVMMAMGLWAFILIQKKKLTAIGLFAASVSIKYATLMMLPGVAGYYLIRRLGRHISWGGVMALALFFPLLTARSQWFHAWYLIWPMSFLPLIKEGWIKETLLMFSFTAMLSYIPYLYTGNFDPPLLTLRSLIIFLPPLSYLIVKCIPYKKS